MIQIDACKGIRLSIIKLRWVGQCQPSSLRPFNHISPQFSDIISYFSLVNQYGNACYTATIIHSQQAMMSSVLVANALNQLHAVAHVIGTNQLPVQELVSNVCHPIG